ncbi:hypothetical protein BJ742DRAFT_813467 [Cladochytrium replicatum]|nr:hypothetical protein BJ742DRAFT_813467 [Cladochytrium replicatum]
MSLSQRWVVPSSETQSDPQSSFSPVDRVLPPLVQSAHPLLRFDPHGPSQNRSTAPHARISNDTAFIPCSGASNRRQPIDSQSPDSLTASQVSQDASSGKPTSTQPTVQLRPLHPLTQQSAGFPPPLSPPNLQSPLPARPQNSPLAQVGESPSPLNTQQQHQQIVSLQRRQSATSQLQEPLNAQQRSDAASSDASNGSVLTSPNRVMSWDSASLAKRLSNRGGATVVASGLTTASQFANATNGLPTVGQAPKRGRPRKRPTVDRSADTAQMEKPPPVPRSSKSPLNPPQGDGATNQDDFHAGQLEALLLRRPFRPDVGQPPAPHRSNTYSGQTRRELDLDPSNKPLPGLRPLALGLGDASSSLTRTDPWFPSAQNPSQTVRKRPFEEAADASKPVQGQAQPASYSGADLERYRRISNPSLSQGLAPPKPAALPTSPRAYASKAPPSILPPPPPVSKNSAAVHTFPPASSSALPRTFSSPAGLAGNNPALHPFAQFRTNNMQPPPRTAPPPQQSSSANEVSSLQPRLSPIPMTVSPTPMHASPASSPDPPTQRKQRLPAVFRQPPSGSDAPAVVLMPSTMKPALAVSLVEEFEECLDKLDRVLNRAEKDSWVDREDCGAVTERSGRDIREAVKEGMGAVVKMMRVACDVLKSVEVATGQLEEGVDCKRRRVEKG